LDSHYTYWCLGRNWSDLWPPRSPDLTPSGFYLWGHLKAYWPFASWEALVGMRDVMPWDRERDINTSHNLMLLSILKKWLTSQ
jgi:hypothetical protein